MARVSHICPQSFSGKRRLARAPRMLHQSPRAKARKRIVVRKASSVKIRNKFYRVPRPLFAGLVRRITQRAHRKMKIEAGAILVLHGALKAMLEDHLKRARGRVMYGGRTTIQKIDMRHVQWLVVHQSRYKQQITASKVFACRLPLR